ncbi:IS5 family transposase [Streptomyces daqingensis]|uniref:IS5 family transposase n=1 Tax=Streptomyces daqingensis TaxID=1472640 RepID=A0ABQ2MQH8_9ACTN|nr:IS5 family transposase [Streptomyces daqingensis]
MLVYPVGVDLSTSALRVLARELASRRLEMGTRWRRLTAGRQALLVLAHLRCGHTYAQLAVGFGVGTTTAYRYINEAIELLAALAPTLAEAMRTAATKAFVILDGTLLPIDRIAADRLFFSGKHKKHGMNVQVITDPRGRLLWASPVLPGAVHDIRAARTHGIIDALEEAGVECWADKGYRGAGGTIRLPYWGAGTHSPQVSRPSTARTRRSAHLSSRPWPPSRPGASCANCDAPPPASPTSSKPSSPCTWPAQTEVGKGSMS